MLTPYDRAQQARERAQALAKRELDELQITGELPADSPFAIVGTLYFDTTTGELVARDADS